MGRADCCCDSVPTVSGIMVVTRDTRRRTTLGTNTAVRLTARAICCCDTTATASGIVVVVRDISKMTIGMSGITVVARDAMLTMTKGTNAAVQLL